jgi:tRNA 2-thiouridine synthesizing protein A
MPSSSSSCSPPTASSPGDVPETTIDLCGEVCPYTFVRTKLALEQVPIGGSLRVVVDHEPAHRTIPRSATEWGQEVLAVTELAGVPAEGRPRWAIDLRRRVR